MHKIPNETKRKVLDAIAQGESPTKLAKKYKVAVGTIYLWKCRAKTDAPVTSVNHKDAEFKALMASAAEAQKELTRIRLELEQVTLSKNWAFSTLKYVTQLTGFSMDHPDAMPNL